MQAAALLKLGRVGPRGLEPVERSGGRGEESKRVKVRTRDRCGLDDRRQHRGREAQRPRVVAHLFRRLPVNHCPFVQAEAAKEGWARLHGRLHAAQPGDKFAAMRGKGRAIDRDGVGSGMGILPMVGGFSRIHRQDARATCGFAILGPAEKLARASPARTTSGPGCQRRNHAGRNA